MARSHFDEGRVRLTQQNEEWLRMYPIWYVSPICYGGLIELDNLDFKDSLFTLTETRIKRFHISISSIRFSYVYNVLDVFSGGHNIRLTIDYSDPP